MDSSSIIFFHQITIGTIISTPHIMVIFLHFLILKSFPNFKWWKGQSYTHNIEYQNSPPRKVYVLLYSFPSYVHIQSRYEKSIASNFITVLPKKFIFYFRFSSNIPLVEMIAKQSIRSYIIRSFDKTLCSVSALQVIYYHGIY